MTASPATQQQDDIATTQQKLKEFAAKLEEQSADKVTMYVYSVLNEWNTRMEQYNSNRGLFTKQTRADVVTFSNQAEQNHKVLRDFAVAKINGNCNYSNFAWAIEGFFQRVDQLEAILAEQGLGLNPDSLNQPDSSPQTTSPPVVDTRSALQKATDFFANAADDFSANIARPYLNWRYPERLRPAKQAQ